LLLLVGGGGGGGGGGVSSGGGEVYVSTKWISKATQCYVCSEGWQLPVLPALKKMKQTSRVTG
jgi:hypothetical protein